MNDVLAVRVVRRMRSLPRGVCSKDIFDLISYKNRKMS